MIPAHIGILLASMAVSAAGAWKVQDWRYGALEASRLEREAEVKRESLRGAQAASAGHEADREKIRTEFVTITERVEKIVQEPVYLNVCFDDAGLRALGAAVAGKRAAASELGAAVR